MATAPRSLASRLAGADSRQLARWTADRARTSRRLASWHAARLRMQTCDALGLLGRLPPGSLRGSSLAEATSNDRFYMEQQRLHGPIFKLFWGSAELKICVVGFPRARRLLHAHRHVLMHPAARDITPLVAANYLRSMPPDLHPHYRRLFKAALPDGLVASLEPELRGIVRRELAGLAEGVPPEADPAARLFAALDRITLKVLLRLVLGVGPDEELARSLEESYRRLGPDGWLADVGPEQVAAFSAIRTAVLAIVGALRSAGTAGFGDSVLGRLVEAGPESSVDDAVIGNVIYLVERGRHDLRDLLRWIVKHLSDNAPFTAELHAALAAPVPVGGSRSGRSRTRRRMIPGLGWGVKPRSRRRTRDAAGARRRGRAAPAPRPEGHADGTRWLPARWAGDRCRRQMGLLSTSRMKAAPDSQQRSASSTVGVAPATPTSTAQSTMATMRAATAFARRSRTSLTR